MALILAVVIAGGGNAIASAIDEEPTPRKERPMLVEDSRGAWHLAMPKVYAAVLRDSVPGFRLWDDDAYPTGTRLEFKYDERTAPFAVIRDLNRDGRLDLVLDGWINEKVVGVVLIVTQDEGFRVIHAGGASAPRRRERAGAGLQVYSRADSTYSFGWASSGDDFSYFFSWSDSLGLKSRMF